MTASRVKPMLARRLREGDYLPPASVVSGGTPHVVRTIEPDLDHPGRIIVTTNQGTWSVDLDKKLTFPRRDDGSIRNWFKEGVHPRPSDLAVGDIVEPAEGPKPPWEEPYAETTQAVIDRFGLESWDDLPDPMKAEDRRTWALAGQEVTGIWAPNFHDTLAWRISCYDKMTRMTRVYDVHAYEPLTFPRPTVSAARAPRPGEIILQVYGPYVHKMTGRRFLFAVHPYGRGRWPANIPHPEYRDQDDGNVHVARPPEFRRDYELFAFRPNDEIPHVEQYPGLKRERHPKDPMRNFL